MPKRKRNSRPACGTQAGYEWHLRHTERPCSYCLVGSTTYSDDEIRDLFRQQRDRDREQQLWSTYKLSLETFSIILALQDNRCGCCKTADPGGTWHVDHDHANGEIRGILCSKCNIGIGQLGDDLEGVQRAVAYLNSYASRGGHKKDDGPPSPRDAETKISARMQECFTLFSGGMPRNSVVVATRLPPEVVSEIYALWKREDVAAGRGPSFSHVFQYPKDPPLRFACSCGFQVLYDDKADPPLSAIESVNEHIKLVAIPHIFQIPKGSPQRCACSCGYEIRCEDPSDVEAAVAEVQAHISAVADHCAEVWKAPAVAKELSSLEEECLALLNAGVRVTEVVNRYRSRLPPQEIIALYADWAPGRVRFGTVGTLAKKLRPQRKDPSGSRT